MKNECSNTKVCKCFFCGEGMLDKKHVNTSSADTIHKFYEKYGYIKYLVGKVGEKLVCNECKDAMHELISQNIRDTITNMGAIHDCF